MTEHFQRLLSSYKNAVYQAAWSQGPRQINWLTQAELNLMSYVTKLEEKEHAE